MNPFAGLVDWLTAPFTAAAGWAWDTITGGITNWLAKGFVQLVAYVWISMDHSTSPHLDAAWFSRTPSSPYATAVMIAGFLLLVMLLVAVIQGVFAGRPMELVKRAGRDTPTAVAGILFTVAFAQIAVDLSDWFANGIWETTRPAAVDAVDNLSRLAAAVSPSTFLSPLLLGVGMLALLVLWVVLIVRDSLIYLTVALCPLAWAVSVWPTLATVRRRILELIGGLIVSKIAIALALAVGLSALGGTGTVGQPGAGVAANGLAEFGVLLVGIVTFGLAAFMPYLVVKLLPLVEGAAIGHGIASAPARAGQQAMQYSYYGQSALTRMAGNHSSRSATSTATRGIGTSAGGPVGAGGAAGGGAAGGGAMAGGGAAGAATAGPAGVAVATAQLVKNTVQTTTAQLTNGDPGAPVSSGAPPGSSPPPATVSGRSNGDGMRRPPLSGTRRTDDRGGA